MSKTVPEVKEIECCVGCAIHHDPKYDLENKIGKCTCPCHTDKNWKLQRITIEVRK